ILRGVRQQQDEPGRFSICSRQAAVVQVQQDALLVVDRQMSYMRQQLSARMLSRYQNNYHFGGSTL
ncbi:conjugal transfer protein TraH, partial [Escherichia coli]|nr:conjugal transfer protein TraH [Escherichia coli]